MFIRLGIFFACLSISAFAWAVTAQEYYSTGNALYEQGKYLDAAKYYQAAIQKDHQNWQAYQGLGNADYKLGNTKEAQTAYKRSLAIHPDNPDLQGFMDGKTPAPSALDEDSPILPQTRPKVASPPPSAPGAVSLAPKDCLPEAGKLTLDLGFGALLSSFQDLQDFYGGTISSNSTPVELEFDLGTDFTIAPNFQLGIQVEGLLRTPENLTANGGGAVTQTWNQHAIGGAFGAKILLPLGERVNLIFHGEGGLYAMVGSNITDTGANTFSWNIDSSNFGGLVEADVELFRGENRSLGVDIGLGYRFLTMTPITVSGNGNGYAGPPYTLKTWQAKNAYLDFSGPRLNVTMRLY